MRLLKEKEMMAFVNALTNHHTEILEEITEFARYIGYRPLRVRIAVCNNRTVAIGCGEGDITNWELSVFTKLSKTLQHKSLTTRNLKLVRLPGVKYVREKQTYGMPPGLLPKRGNVTLFYQPDDNVIFPVYKCLDIVFPNRAVLSIVSPKSVIKEKVKVRHPIYNEIYRGVVSNAELSSSNLLQRFPRGVGLGVLLGLSRFTKRCEAVYLLGDEDFLAIVKAIQIGGGNFLESMPS